MATADAPVAGDRAFADLRIVDVHHMGFSYRSLVGRDDEGHTHPAPEHDARQTLTRVRTSAGVDGHCFGGSAGTAATATRMIADLNPFDRELIWTHLRQAQRLERDALPDQHLSVIDLALWDVAGQILGLPVSKILGGAREKVATYGDFAAACQA